MGNGSRVRVVAALGKEGKGYPMPMPSSTFTLIDPAERLWSSFTSLFPPRTGRTENDGWVVPRPPIGDERGETIRFTPAGCGQGLEESLAQERIPRRVKMLPKGERCEESR